RRRTDQFLVDLFPGHDDFDFGAALGRFHQFFAGQIVRQKISVLDSQTFFCRSDCEQIQEIEIFVMRTAADGLCLQGTAVLKRREIIVAVKHVASRLYPVADEAGLKLGYDWPYDFVM